MRLGIGACVVNVCNMHMPMKKIATWIGALNGGFRVDDRGIDVELCSVNVVGESIDDY
jgi:hypothetical protein